ncbi:MAG: hypothetical protein IT422_08335 [Pirellulaceae bacterium]|jgi:hypothetical protein|nr:hypothetical protein [Pirellulaceae bacterium]
MKKNMSPIAALMAFVACWGYFSPVHAQWSGREDVLREVEKLFGDPPGMVRLDPRDRVWVDKTKKRVVVDGYIALRDGALEMLACLVGTKEHESIVATFCKAQTVHAALLAVGAEQGKPVQWEPFSPPTGSEIQISALWFGANGEKKHIDVRQWLRVIGTKDEILKPNWVFAGSILWEDPDTGDKLYQAEGGDLVCVSNFSTATLDIPLESSQVNSGLMFASFSERIPPLRTPVRLVLQVVSKENATNSSTNPESAQGNADSTATQASPPAKINAPAEDNQSTGESPTTTVPKDLKSPA